MKKEKWLQYMQKPTTILFLLSIVFFFIYSFLSYPYFSNDDFAILNQPDESINYIFARHLVETGDFVIPEGLSYIANNQVHPRSTTLVYHSLTPIGFPGIIVIFGCITKIICFLIGVGGINSILLSITPFLAVASSFLLYFFIKSIFGKRIGLISALLLFILPPWWYYGSRVMQQSTVFVFFLLFTFFCGMKFLQAQDKRWKQNIFACFTGLSFGLTVYVRPAELPWLLLLGGVLLFLLRKQYTMKDFLFFLLGGTCIAILFFFTQQVYYDSFIGTGYAVPQSNGSAGILTDNFMGGSVNSFLFPFGLDILQALRVLYVYGLKLILWWTLFGFLGFIFLFRQRKQYIQEWKYTILFLCVSTWILLTYGSWHFTDNLSGEPSFAVSYTRYFLPIYVFSLPLVAFALEKLLRF
ncbi:MAG: glycosyltransferase family 39 protein, partial [Candidatus Magasanikbacteria bacterium]